MKATRGTLAWLPAIVGSALLLPASCADEAAGPSPREVRADADDVDHLGFASARLRGEGEIARAFEGGAARFEPGSPFRQVGFLFDADPAGLAARPLEARTRGLDGSLSAWAPVEITWSEGRHHVGRLRLGEPALGLELRAGGKAEPEAPSLSSLSVEFAERLLATNEVLTRDLPRDAPAGPGPEGTGVGAASSAVAPEDLVIPRTKWGARNPGKICGDVVKPYRMSVHHTYEPADDGGDGAARLRQIQAFHIDVNGWCDIGYHFVVSQAGDIYQGRSDERRPGAHVANQNAGNVGVCLIGDFTQKAPGAPQFQAAARILAWVGETYGIPLTTAHVKGHRQWPGQATSCPGDALLPKIPELLELAKSSPSGPVEPEGRVKVAVAWEGADDFVPEGSSAAIPDALGGDALEARVAVENGVGSAIEGVRVGLSFDGAYLRPKRYVIESDHPAKDGETFEVNDADSAPENPPKDGLESGAVLSLYALGAGETKRVRIEFEAKGYSFGQDEPAVRAWVRHIDGLYGDQGAFGEDPATNAFEGRLEGEARLDVLSASAWRWEGGSKLDREGWGPCEGSGTALEVGGGALGLEPAGQGACAASPPWTAIDAGAFDQVVLRPKAGSGSVEVRWKKGGAVAGFAQVALSGADSVVVPVGGLPGWEGSVDGLEVASAEALALDALFVQSSESEETSLPGEPYDGTPPAALEESGGGDDFLAGGNGAATGSCACRASPPSRSALSAALAFLAAALAGARRRGRAGARVFPRRSRARPAASRVP